mmetsp:Transcript_28629/g.71993  ORF Transcript_28629/g.71993 Transcript_28629/m.71993 type:complete len:450 (-) Transcript_28629:35-1384(-)
MATVLEDFAAAMDGYWLIPGAAAVFFMQCGFLSLEVGSVRVKNTKNILLKNSVSPCIAIISWWMYGFALAFGGDEGGGNEFVGEDEFFLINSNRYIFFFFEWTFQAAAGTIISGPLAERIRFEAFCILNFVVSGVIYPFVAHWVWSPHGWLNDHFSVVDFAGSGVVHLLGGIAAICMTVILGARDGRFDDQGKPVEIPGHSIALVALGLLVLWFGWLSFNACSSLTIAADGGAFTASKAVLNTTLSPMAALIVSMIFHKVYYREYIVPKMMNAALCATCAITGPSGVVNAASAVWIGVYCVVFYEITSDLLLYFKIDDAVDAFPVHAVGGALGVINVGLFAEEELVAIYRGDHIKDNGTIEYTTNSYGLLMGGGWELLGGQLLELVTIVVWTAIISCIAAGGLRLAGLLRVDKYTEEQGLDKVLHKGYGYTSIQVKVSDYINVRKDMFV